jgi:SNF2 family DNA or RNA helicase
MAKRIARQYMLRSRDFLRDNPESGLFLEPGLGKTGITLDLILELKKEPDFQGVLVLAPLRPCYLVWPKEMRKWDQFKKLSYTILHGDNKDANFEKKRDVYIMNYDGLGWLSDKLYGKRRTQWPFNILVCDESGKVRRTKSIRYKLLKKLAPKFSRRHILNGTPIPKGLRDLFGQFHILDGGKTFGKEVTKFDKKYFYKSGFMGKELKPLPAAPKRIFNLIAPSILQMKAEDYLELPELIINKIYVELPTNIRQLYNQMEKDFLLKFKEGKVTAANAGILSSKCRQIACGGIYLDSEEQKWKNLHTKKIEVAQDLIEELQGNPALLAYEFQHDLDRLYKAFGSGVPTIRGRMSMLRTQQVENQWNKGEIDLLFGQHTAIALGLNLQESGNTMIVHTLPWSYDTWYQLIRRIYRQGQKSKTVFVHVIIAKNTVEELVWKSLQGDDKTHISLFDALKDYWGE